MAWAPGAPSPAARSGTRNGLEARRACVRVDIGTHLLVPYAAALLAFGYWRRDEPGDRTRASWAAVFGVAGFAPDLDGLVDPLSVHVDALWWLQHRGVSHTLVGAPVFALALIGILAILARRFPARFGLFAWRPALVLAAVLGSFTHLLLDAITYSGVPLFWPFHHGRVSFQLFHWLVIWLLPFAGIALGAHAVGRFSRRGIIRAGAIVVAALVVVAGVRAWSRPRDEPEGTLVFPQSSDVRWTVLAEHPNGSWEGHTYRLGERFDYAWFEPTEPPEAADAVRQARATDAYKGFHMGAFGPEVVRAVPSPDGGWSVTFLDAAQRYEATHNVRWAPVEPFEAWGYVAFVVRGDGVEVTHRGW